MAQYFHEFHNLTYDHERFPHESLVAWLVWLRPVQLQHAQRALAKCTCVYVYVLHSKTITKVTSLPRTQKWRPDGLKASDTRLEFEMGHLSHVHVHVHTFSANRSQVSREQESVSPMKGIQTDRNL